MNLSLEERKALEHKLQASQQDRPRPTAAEWNAFWKEKGVPGPSLKKTKSQVVQKMRQL